MKKLLQMKLMLLLFALIVGSGTMWADTKTEGFETKAATTTYNGTVSVSTTESDCGISWQIYYGTVSTNDKISGDNSAQMRWYSSATSNYPYIMTTTAVDGLSNVSLKARTNSTNVKMDLSYSADGTTWTVGKTYTFTETGKGVAVSLDIPSGNKYVKFGVSSSSTAPSSGNLKLIVDDVVFTYGDTPTTWTVTYDGNGATSGTVPTDATAYESGATVTVLGNTGDLAKTGCAFDGWNTQANGGGTNYDADDTFTISANTTLYAKWTPYTITALSNNESYGTVSLSDNVITGSPNSGYRYANPAYTVSPENSATVVQDGNTFTVTPTANTTITINFEAIPTHTATFSVNGTTTTTDFQEGAAITFPANPADIEGKSFVGWTGTAISGTTDETPTFVTSATMGNADMTFYAVFANAEGDSETKQDVLTSSVTGNTTSSYANFSNKSVSGGSNAVYAGNCAGSNSYIQLRTSSNTGIVSTTSGGKAKKVTVSWSSTSDRALQVYGSNTAYTGLSDIFDDNKKGTLLGTLTYGSTTELSITGNYAYIGIKPDSSKSGASQLSNITIDWETSSITYSGYCTTVAADTREEAGLSFTESTKTVEWYEAENYKGQSLNNPNSVSPIIWTSSNEGVATVENGTVTVLALGETTIKASFDGDENYKKGEASYTLTVKDSRLEPTVTIDDTFITHTNVFEGTAAGKLTASVKYNDNTIEGATVTWSGDNDAVATINASSGTVDLVAAGTVTFTATYAGNADYSAKTATYEMTVTYSDPNAPGTENNPYTVAEARAAIDAGTGVTDVYATGIVSKIVTPFNSQYGNISYNISADGSTENDQLQAYRGKGIGGDDFTSADDIQVGDVVVVKGNLINYQGTYEFAQGNQLVSLVRKPAAPTFSPAAGTYTSTQYVTISAAEGAAIYYTTDGTDPTTESNLYSEPIEVNTDMTIKAIAVKDSEISTVATAEYVINLTPVIALDETEIEAPYTQIGGTIGVTYANFTPSYESLYVQFYDEDDNEINDCDWMSAVIDENDINTLNYFITTNDGDEERTAYLRVCWTAGTAPVVSDLITVTQAKFVEFVTYSLAKDIKPGKHYIIVGKTGNDDFYAMGTQNTNNRAAVEVTDNDGTISVAKNGLISEFIIDMDGGNYSIYDEAYNENEGGYLYAASSSNNYLKTQAINDDDNGRWTIDIDNESGVATVIAQGTNDNNVMRFNFSSKLFSCYNVNNNQRDIYLYENDNELVIPIAAACTDGTNCFGTFSSTKPFVVPEDLTVSEIGINTDGTMNVVNYVTGAVVPANTGVMVSAAVGDRSYVANVSTEVGNNVLNGDNRLRPTGDNDLTATEMTSAEPETCKFYRLTMHGAAENNPGKIGFWWGNDGGNSFDIAANKAYLAVPASVAGARNGFAFGDDATGISNVNVNLNDNDNCYDLQGRKVSKPGKGLYIVNGKKVVIK